MTPPPDREPWRLAYWWLASGSLLITFSGSAPSALYPLYQQRWGFPTWTLTVVFATFICGILSALLIAPVANNAGLRPTLLTACGLGLAGVVLFLTADGLPWLITASFVQGTCVGLYQSTANVALLELVPAGRYAMATLGSSRMGAVGLAAGPLLAGILAQYAPSPLLLIYLVEVAAFGILLAGAVRTAAIGSGAAARVRPDGVAGRLDSESRILFLVAFLAFASGAFINAVGATILVTWLNVNNLAVGGIAVTLLFTSSAIAQSWVMRLPMSLVVRGGLLCAVAGLLAAVLALTARNIGLMMTAVIIVGVGQGAAYAGSLGWLNRMVPAALRATATSRYYLYGYVGAVLPTLIGGWALAELGVAQAMLVFAGIIGLPSAVVMMTLRNADRAGHVA